MTWLVIILLIVAVYVIFFLTQFYNIIFKDYAPAISTNRKVIEKVINEIKIIDQEIVLYV